MTPYKPEQHVAIRKSRQTIHGVWGHVIGYRGLRMALREGSAAFLEVTFEEDDILSIFVMEAGVIIELTEP